MVSKQKQKPFKIVVCRYMYKPSKRIRTSRRCSECRFIVAVESVKIGGTAEEDNEDNSINFNSYEDYLVMERFNNWMQQEHSV
jgi:hypothetical protein